MAVTSIERRMISTCFVDEALNSMRQRGMAIEPVLAAAGLPASVQEPVSAERYGALWLAIAAAIDDEFFGLGGRPMRLGSFTLADSSSITNTLRISCRDGVGGLVHQRGEHLVGCRKAKRLARPAVEPGRDRVEFGLREHRQVSALG